MSGNPSAAPVVLDSPKAEIDDIYRRLVVTADLLGTPLASATSERWRRDYEQEVRRLAVQDPAVRAAAKAQATVIPAEELRRRVRAAQLDVQAAAIALEQAANDPRRGGVVEGLRTDLAAAKKQAADLEALAGVDSARHRVAEVQQRLAAAQGDAQSATLTDDLRAAERALAEAEARTADRMGVRQDVALALAHQSIAPGEEVTAARGRVAVAERRLKEAEEHAGLPRLRGELETASQRLERAEAAAEGVQRATLAQVAARDAVSALMHRRVAELRTAYEAEETRALEAAQAAFVGLWSRWLVARRLSESARVANPNLDAAAAVARAAVEQLTAAGSDAA